MRHPVETLLRRSRSILRRPAVAAVAVAVALTGASTAAATGRLQIFQTEKVAPVTFNTADLVGLPDLRAYGEVEITSEPELQEVPDAATAATETGLKVPQLARLPRGVSGEPVYQVGRAVSATFTFLADRASESAAETGQTSPPPPPGLDGTQVRLVAGPGLAQIWSRPEGVPSLVVGRAVAPSATSTGARFETVRDYLLSLPGVPDKVAAQLRTFTGDGSTLPVPVPADRFTSSSAEVDGNPATVLISRDRTMAAAVWVDDGVVTVVAGALDADEVLTIARDLR